MKILYLDCSMGAAGDMLAASLYELLNDNEKKEFVDKVNGLGLKAKVEPEKSVKCGIVGTHMKVTVDGVEEDEHLHEHDHDHSHDHNHEHDHDHSHEHNHEHDHGHEHSHEHEHYHEDAHSHGDHHGDDNHHDHSHEHEHDHTHSHDHSHDHGHHHVHTSMNDIENIISGLNVSEEAKHNAQKVYMQIAKAESNAHGKPVDEIHFHEVGTADAVADVVAVCMLLDMIKPDKIVSSVVSVGYGSVKCAHGILPVPAPATAFILKDVPIKSGDVESELCTPTGAALLKNFVSEYGNMPVMKAEAIGYGMGKKDFNKANCVRAILGQTVGGTDSIVELTCNVDDMTGERIGFAMERLLDAGALEVYNVPVGMKKSRPGYMLCVMCRENIKEEIIGLIFKHTTTLGIRENISNRFTLERSVETRNTQFGDVRVKVSKGYGVVREKYEYEDLAEIARRENMSVEDVIKSLK